MSVQLISGARSAGLCSSSSSATRHRPGPEPAIAAVVRTALAPRRTRRLLPATEVVLCRAASTSPSPSRSSGSASSSSQAGEQLPIRVALDSSAQTVAEAVRVQLARYGGAQLWATSAANHFTAIQGLAEAAAALAARTQQQAEQAAPAGFAARLALSASDQPEADDMKRTMRKLTVSISPAAPVPAGLWQPGHEAHVSANRARGVGELVEAMGGPLSSGLVVVEARGEQAVTRSLKAALSLQAAGPGLPLLLQPWRGAVVDVVAERRGEARTAGGLLLLFRWADDGEQTLQPSGGSSSAAT